MFPSRMQHFPGLNRVHRPNSNNVAIGPRDRLAEQRRSCQGSLYGIGGYRAQTYAQFPIGIYDFRLRRPLRYGTSFAFYRLLTNLWSGISARYALMHPRFSVGFAILIASIALTLSGGDASARDGFRVAGHSGGRGFSGHGFGLGRPGFGRPGFGRPGFGRLWFGNGWRGGAAYLDDGYRSCPTVIVIG